MFIVTKVTILKNLINCNKHNVQSLSQILTSLTWLKMIWQIFTTAPAASKNDAQLKSG